MGVHHAEQGGVQLHIKQAKDEHWEFNGSTAGRSRWNNGKKVLGTQYFLQAQGYKVSPVAAYQENRGVVG